MKLNRIFSVITIAFALTLSALGQTQTTVTTVYQQPGVISATDLAQAFIGSVDKQVAKQNSSAATNFNGACSDWTVNNLHNRDLGLPLTTKPIAPPTVHLTVKLDGPASGPINISLSTTLGPDPLAVCPDLPALPVPKANMFVLGAPMVAPPGWYSVGQGDTMPANSVSQAPDGSRYFKYAIPFGAYYIKVQ